MDLSSSCTCQKILEEFSLIISNRSWREHNWAVSVVIYQVHQKQKQAFGGSTNCCEVFNNKNQAQIELTWTCLNLLGSIYGEELYKRALLALWQKLHSSKAYTVYRSHENPTTANPWVSFKLVRKSHLLLPLVSGHLAHRLEVYQALRKGQKCCLPR